MSQYTKNESLLTVRNLSVVHGTNTVLKDINLEIKNIVRPGLSQGQVVALLGPSGIGKTQLFRCLAGLQKPTTGEIMLNGDKHVSKPGEVGVVAQNYTLFQHRTVLSNLKVVTKIRGLTETDALKEIDKHLENFGLTEHKNKYPAQLSGGQRQRLAIIQQLLCSKYFLLMDEPFSGLDVVSKSKVCNLIQQVGSAHELNTIILTTHDIHAALEVADTVWILGRTFEGQKNKGATLVKELDLIERGLAWSPDVKNLPAFKETATEIENLFFSL